MTTELKHIPLLDILEPEESLRKVDKTTEEYQGLVESVRIRGILNPITVREIKDKDTGVVKYGLVDGLQRFSSAKDVGLETVPSHVIQLEEAELIEAQVIANVHKIETKPVEYSRALLKILQNNPLLTRTELANKLAKTPAWISERLGLLKLTDQIGSLVDEGAICLSNAYALAKLPIEEQENFIDRAMTMPPQQFVATVNTRVKEIREANRKGKDAAPEEFQAVPILRARKDLIDEMDNPRIGPALIKEAGISDAPTGFALGIKWALNLDPRSVEIQRAKDEERRAAREEAKEKAKRERAQKRAKEAAEKAEKLKQEADALAEETEAAEAASSN